MTGRDSHAVASVVCEHGRIGGHDCPQSARDVHGRCLSCGDTWVERAGNTIVVCLECGSLDVVEESAE